MKNYRRKKIIKLPRILKTRPTKEREDKFFSWLNSLYKEHNLPIDIEKQLENNFTYHPPKDDQSKRYETLRDKAKQLAFMIVAYCPDSRERSLALTNLEQVIFWANASIARNE